MLEMAQDPQEHLLQTHSATRPRKLVTAQSYPDVLLCNCAVWTPKEDRPRYSRYCRLHWTPGLRGHLVGWVGQDEEEFVQADARTRKGGRATAWTAD